VRVLVTDAEYKLTLGVIRSLGRRGAEVVAVAARRRAEGFFSRYAHETAVLPPPEDGERFAEAVLGEIRSRRIDVVLPVAQGSNAALSRARDELAGAAAIVVAPWDSMQLALSKARTIELARELGIRVPRTYAAGEPIAAFPVVAKKIVGSGEVRYVNEQDELAAIGSDWLVQEYVPGEGRGFFALMDEGEVRASFMHRRVREYPVTGGASTAAESIDDPDLRELGLRLLRALRWHGVAMVEFKHDARDGGYTLMELNPKFWGSLDLAIACGVDFPWLAVQVALGRPFRAPAYRRGRRFQWLFSDLLHAAARPRDTGAVLRDLVDPRVEDDLWWRDPKPNLFEGYLTAAALVVRMRNRTLRYPHGRPAVPGAAGSGR
jgi:predicted ATP-grasp superfamily ATP-dependent carboligase